MTAVWAHRGDASRARENTLEAFIAARDRGADGVELDVRQTADGALVVHHDPLIPGIGPVATISVADRPGELPLLVEALGACTGLTVNIEIKSDQREPWFDPDQGTARALAEMLGPVAEATATSVVVSSFHRRALETVRAAGSAVPLGWLWSWDGDAHALLARSIADGWQAVHPFVTQVDEGLVDAAHRAGLAVNVWTVNARGDLEKMVDLGVDAVITDQVGVAREVVDALGAGRWRRT